MIRRGPVLLLLAASLEAALSAENITNDTADEILSAADQLNINTNSEGDLDTFLSAIFLNSMIAAGCILAFSILRVRFPIVYSHLQPESNKALAGEPSEPSVQTLQSRAWAIKAKLCDWVGYSINTSIEDAVDRAGLDAALLREYTWLAARVLGSIGIPMCLIAIPVTKTLGGNGDVDKLSQIEMAAVQDNHAWLFYAHAVVVWLVCFVVHYWLFSAQAKFLDLRVKWLTNLPAPRSTTVMVEDIPKEWRSDAKLKQFFGKIFSPEDVREAHVVQYADALAKAVSKREQLLAIKRQAEATMEKTGKEEMIRPTCCGSKVDALEYANDGLQGMDEDIVELLHKCRDSQEKDPAATGAHCGFVTFTGRRFAEMAQSLQIHADRNQWQVSAAPPADDLRWSDLRGSRELNNVKRLMGFLCVAGLYIGFMPITLAITVFAKQLDVGPFQPLWNAFAPTLGLTIFLSLLPSVMMAIFRAFFVLKAESFAQHKLQFWFFVFQLIFVVLVTTVGNSLLHKFTKLVEEPTSIFTVLGASVPNVTHYYMTYLVLQWSAHAMEMLRYMNLIKFQFFKVLFTPEEAKNLSEPENQDSFGFGARSVNLSINVVLGILFCSISPLMPVLAMIDCLLARLIYGYLVIYTETKKPDLGGAFWVTQLGHMHLALVLYVILMVGVLQLRSDEPAPGIIAACSLVFVLWSAIRFRQQYRWQRLPFKEVAFVAEETLDQQKDEGRGEGELSAKCYVQPELRAAESLEVEARMP